MSTKEYQKKTGYAAQKKYAAKNYSHIVFSVYKPHKNKLEMIARERGISLSKLIIEALSAQYQIDFSKPRPSDACDEF